MGRAPCCDKANVKRGPWSPEEDATLKNYLHKHGTGGNWISLPQRAGLKRCGKSCRLRWLNYLRPDIKHGAFTEEEDNIIISLYYKMGSRWSVIAANLQGRTDNDVKNHWNTKLKKKLFGGGDNNKLNPKIKAPFTNYSNLINPITQVPNSSSIPTPSTSPSLSPSPSYINNNHTYNHNDQNLPHHQFYVPIPSFSNLLAQCTNNDPMSIYNTSTDMDHPYTHNPVSNLSSIRYPFHQVGHQVQSISQSSSALMNVCPQEEVSSISRSSLEDDPFLAELGFGLIQEVMMNPSSNYNDQEDIKPQGLGQGLVDY